jgi:hypothetical protein
MSTPAEELRAAATKLRETGVDAASDRWNALFPDVKAIHIKPMNAWIRLVSPVLAEPLAIRLEEAARQCDLNEYRAPRHRFDPASDLAVARAINGDPR